MIITLTYTATIRDSIFHEGHSLHGTNYFDDQDIISNYIETHADQILEDLDGMIDRKTINESKNEEDEDCGIQAPIFKNKGGAQ